jgi:photosystem II stability/assembly factor-like uncharacterized protein
MRVCHQFLVIATFVSVTGCVVASPPPGIQPATGGKGSGGSPSQNGGQSDQGGTGSGGDNGNGGNNGGGGAGGAAEPTGPWVPSAANLTGMQTICSVGGVYVNPNNNQLLAAIARVGFFNAIEGDGGRVWELIDSTKTIVNRPFAIVWDPDEPKRYWECGGYYGPFLYRTDDDGQTWNDLSGHGMTADVDALGSSDLVSIDFSDPDRKTLLIGAHERKQSFMHSKDGGKTWDNVGGTLPSAAGFSSVPIVIDSKTYIGICVNNGEDSIYRTTDGGASWTKVFDQAGPSEPLKLSDGTYVISGNNADGLLKTTDNGETWKNVSGKDVIQWPAPRLLPDRRIAAVGTNNSIVVSDDGGVHWKQVTSRLPNTPNGFVYSPNDKAFFVNFIKCVDSTAAVPDSAIMRYDFDYMSDTSDVPDAH